MDRLIGKAMGMAGAVVAAASMLGGCATAPGASYVAPAAGATWSTLQRNTGSFGSGEARLDSVRGDMVWEGRQMITFKNNQGTVVADPALGNWVAILAPDGKLATRFEPPMGYEWPLTVGKEMKVNYKMVNAAGAGFPVSSTCKVENYEDIAIRAGTFKTFRIACTNDIGSDVSWYAPDIGIFVKTSQRRGPNHPAGAGTRETEIIAHHSGR